MKDSKFAINRVARICIMSTAIVGMVMLLGASSLIKNTRHYCPVKVDEAFFETIEI